MKEIPATVAIRLYPLLRKYHFQPDPDSEMLIEVADEIVVLLCQSFRDQELDVVLEVMGRAKGYADTKGYDSGFRGQADVELVIDEHDVPKRGISDGDRLEFIVLPPGAASGEEEE